MVHTKERERSSTFSCILTFAYFYHLTIQSLYVCTSFIGRRKSYAKDGRACCCVGELSIYLSTYQEPMRWQPSLFNFAFT